MQNTSNQEDVHSETSEQVDGVYDDQLSQKETERDQ